MARAGEKGIKKIFISPRTFQLKAARKEPDEEAHKALIIAAQYFLGYSGKVCPRVVDTHYNHPLWAYA